MKSQEPQEKKFRQLSDEELEKVTGGTAVAGGMSCKRALSASCQAGYYLDGRQCCLKCNTDWSRERELCKIKGLSYSIDECHCV